MKTKILTIFSIILFSGMFSACAEEEILPQEQLETGGDNTAGEGTTDSKGEWD